MVEPLGYPTETCRSCKAVVRWAVDGNGDRLLLDVPALPVRATAFEPANGDVLLTERPDFLPAARRVLKATELFAKREVWRRHIVTCPQAGYWAGKARKKASIRQRRSA